VSGPADGPIGSPVELSSEGAVIFGTTISKLKRREHQMPGDCISQKHALKLNSSKTTAQKVKGTPSILQWWSTFSKNSINFLQSVAYSKKVK
jgi:hypothetical protein